MATHVTAREQQLVNMVLAALDADPAFVPEILADAHAAWVAAAQADEGGTSITWSGEASEGFSDRVGNMQGWCVRVTPLDGTAPFDGVIVGTDQATVIDGTTWWDAVKLLPADEAGFAIEGAEPVTVRVRDLFVY